MISVHVHGYDDHVHIHYAGRRLHRIMESWLTWHEHAVEMYQTRAEITHVRPCNLHGCDESDERRVPATCFEVCGGKKSGVQSCLNSHAHTRRCWPVACTTCQEPLRVRAAANGARPHLVSARIGWIRIGPPLQAAFHWLTMVVGKHVH